MLILVAVTITTAVNGGLFSYAGKATSEYKKAQIKEEVNTAWYVAQMESAINSYSNEEIAEILQKELRKNEAMAEVIWNSSENKYEIYYKGYKMAIDSNGKMNDSIEDIVKTELVLAIEDVQDTESGAKLVTISVDGFSEEMAEQTEKKLENYIAEQTNKKDGTNYTYKEICEKDFGEYKTLSQVVEIFSQMVSGINTIQDYFNVAGEEIPDECTVTLITTSGEIYKILALNEECTELVLNKGVSLQVESNRYTSNAITQEIENNETYSTIYAQKTELEIDGYKVTVPAGFAVGESDTSIGSVSTGLVITDSVVAEDGKRYSNGNEFVWIPVETNTDGNPVVAGTDKVIAKLKDGSTTDYSGVLYEFTETTSSVLESSNYEEPKLLEDSTYGDTSSYNTVGITAEVLQTEYNSMIASIKQYGGFYVGRYEMGEQNNKPVSKIGVLPLENVNTEYNWYYMYKAAKEYSNENVQASMIWGSQYDAMLNFALQGNDKEKVTSTEYGNYTSLNTHYSPLRTGCTPTLDRINNIYDLGGNVKEWTMEKYSGGFAGGSMGNGRVVRGGHIYGNSGPASNRYQVKADTCGDIKGTGEYEAGSRFTLLLK